MWNNDYKSRVNKIIKLQEKLANTYQRSNDLITKFTDNQNEETLNLAWSALEMITSCLEDIQSELVKFNYK